MSNNKNQRTIFANPDIDVIVTSSGGGGTTFLINEIARYKRTNDSENMDGLKHIPIPPLSKNPNIKAIYIFGNPILACVSLFHRKYHYTQSRMVQKFYVRKHLVAYNKKIQSYASEGKESLFFRRHLNNWNQRYNLYPILFIRYESLFSHLDELSDFLGLPPEFKGDFPSWKPRSSNFEGLSANTKADLEALYGPMNNEIKQWPDCFLVPGQNGSVSRLFLTSNLYRTAFLHAIGKRYPLLRSVGNKLKLNRFTSDDLD